MKFAVTVVVLALALGAHSGFVPLPYSYVASPLSYTAVSGPGYVHTPVVTSYSVPHVVGTPVVRTYTGPVVSTYTAPVVPAEASYVAQTRGSVHVAPLPGHVNSAASVNLEAAPGTL